MTEYTDLLKDNTPAPLDKLGGGADIIRDSSGKFITSGNPLGRPKSGPLITPILRRMLEKEEEPNASTVAVSLFKLATQPGSNQFPAIKEVLDRTDGKVREQIEVESRNITLIYELKQGE